jgi:hypothetical protein
MHCAAWNGESRLMQKLTVCASDLDAHVFRALFDADSLLIERCAWRTLHFSSRFLRLYLTETRGRLNSMVMCALPPHDIKCLACRMV